MRIAALDLGSNSFHLLVVETRLDGSFVMLVRDKETLRLGDVVAQTGVIGRKMRAVAVDVVRRFKVIAEAQRADEVIALGTAALREAFDGGDFVDEVREETGLEIMIVDGLHEAQLIFQAVCASVLIEERPALAADLGGGSLELMVGDKNELMLATSVRLGVGRLTAELVYDDPISKRDLERLRGRITEELDPIFEEIYPLKPKMLIGSSGTFTALARMTAARIGALPDVVNQLTIQASAFDDMAAAVMPLSLAERARVTGCDAQRAASLPAGIAVLQYLFQTSGLETLTISDWALREGIILNSIGRHDPADLTDDPRAIRRASVLSLCRRSNWRQPHARQVALLAAQLFDATALLHRRKDDDRELLEFGAHLHDIGEHVSRSGHDRHTAYLIENGGLRGFSPNEVQALSCLGRYHVRGTPRPNFEAFSALDENDRERTVALVCLLRLADALDASHAGVVERVEVDFDEHSRNATVTLMARGDAELEQWMFRRKQELFERTFGVNCMLRHVRTGAGVFENADAQTAGLG